MRAIYSAGDFLKRLYSAIRENMQVRKLSEEPGGYFNEKMFGTPHYDKSVPSNGRTRKQSMRSKIRKTKYRRINRAKYAR